MGFTKATIVNCKKASIRRVPWIPLYFKEIVGIRDGATGTNTGEIKQGSTINVDLDQVCYDWTGRKFYKVQTPSGWIYEGVIDVGG